MSRFKRTLLFPFLFAIFPILTLLGSNIRYISVWMPWRSFAVSIAISAILFISIHAITKSWTKAALIVSLLNLIFYSYGYLYQVVEDFQIFGWIIGRHRYLLSSLFLITIGLCWWIGRSRLSFTSLVIPLNVIGLALWIMPLYQIISYRIHQNSTLNRETSFHRVVDTNEDFSIPAANDPGKFPDIYYIILDTYARRDVLSECFRYDNSAFLDSLTASGFVVAEQSRSNITITDLSLASSLNMEYPQDLASSSVEIGDPVQLSRWIKYSKVRQVFEQAGYTFIAFDSGYSQTRILDADVFYSLDQRRHPILGGLNPFESLVIKTSAGIVLYDFYGYLPETVRRFLDSSYRQHRDLILFTLDKLPSIAEDPRATFTFVHILAPHNPFVFGPNGENISRQTPFTLNDDPETKDSRNYRQGYIDQITYLNQRIISIIQEIQSRSATRPVIVLQGDHGPPRWVTSMTGRSDILNAYSFEGAEKVIYPSITPVNSFRIILNEVFGARLKLLPDRTFYTTHSTIDQLLPIDKDKKHCDSTYRPDLEESQTSSEVE